MSELDLAYELYQQELAEIYETERDRAVARTTARLEATIRAVKELAEDVDDDGSLALVSSERLARALGFARRNWEDMEARKLYQPDPEELY